MDIQVGDAVVLDIDSSVFKFLRFAHTRTVEVIGKSPQFDTDGIVHISHADAPHAAFSVHRSQLTPAPIEVGDLVRIASKAEAEAEVETSCGSDLVPPGLEFMGTVARIIRAIHFGSVEIGLRAENENGKDYFSAAYARRIYEQKEQLDWAR